MKKLRVLALVDDTLVPPEDTEGIDTLSAPWKTEFDVIETLREEGHHVHVLGLGSDLGPIKEAIQKTRSQIAFNMIEAFDNVATFDYNVVAYLELLRQRYTGCNSRGLVLARDKSISKKILHYHRIPMAGFEVFARGRRVKAPSHLDFPLIVKSLTLDASIGISQASVVEDEARLVDRVRFVHESLDTDALVEEYIEGRELYVGLLGNKKVDVLPIWELDLRGLPADAHPIATERLKWNLAYQKKHKITSGPAKSLPDDVRRNIVSTSKHVYRHLELSGYARLDLRLRKDGQIFVMEANPNPQLAYGEDFAESAEKAGMGYGALLERIMALGLRWETGRLG